MISSFDIPADIEDYYWLSPNQFTGNKLTAYGSSLRFNISWVIMRGDSSGRQMLDPDVIIIVSFIIIFFFYVNSPSVGWQQFSTPDASPLFFLIHNKICSPYLLLFG